ncbi:MAG: hypothetical protein LBE59_03415 [Nevskiaceae bacterium]|jgi:predicted peptidase|nr:hypothetical protein [Nevskiaceae bacterium]
MNMKTHWVRIAMVAALLMATAGASFGALAEVAEHTLRVSGMDVHYKVVLPDGYDAAKRYPAVLVFGGGPQTMETINRTLERNFQAEAQRRGYIVIAPAAPNGQLFFERGERIFPAFLDAMLREYPIEGGKFHVAGPSNGGIAAMHIAAKYPRYFISVTAFPGFLWEPNEKKLLALLNHCVYLYVGENDEYRWHDEMKSEVEFLRSRRTVATYTVEKGQPHGIATLAGEHSARFFEGFEAAKKGCSR